MLKSWKIVFPCQKGTRANAQTVYDQLIYAALIYRYPGASLNGVRLDDRELTESIFSLTDHDKVTTHFEGVERHITGKDLKELFISSIVLKHIEEMNKYPDGTGLFVVLPEEIGSCDVAIIASDPSEVKLHSGEVLRLSAEHDPYELQVKEYYDHARAKGAPTTPRDIDISTLTEIVDGYEEYVVVLMRDLVVINNQELDAFFKTHPRVILISMPRQPSIAFTDLKGQAQEVYFPKGKHNYLVTFPSNMFAIVSFDWPQFLVPESSRSEN